MKRLASIDIGTQTIRLLVADCNSTGIVEVLNCGRSMARLGEDIELSAGDELMLMFFLSDVCYRYSGRVSAIDVTGQGAVEVSDGPVAEILNQRKKLRITADISCTCYSASKDRLWPARIMDIDVQGAGLLIDEPLKIANIDGFEKSAGFDLRKYQVVRPTYGKPKRLRYDAQGRNRSY